MTFWYGLFISFNTKYQNTVLSLSKFCVKFNKNVYL